MKLSALKVDAARAEQGAWVGNIPDMGDLRLKVRGIDNVDARRLRNKLLDGVPRDKRVNGRVDDPTILDGVTAQVLAETVLIDWSGLSGDDDAPLPFSAETARTILSDPNYRPFLLAVLWASNSVGETAAETQAADTGN